MVLILSALLPEGVDDEISNSIREGYFSQVLLKPIKHLWFSLIEALSWKSFKAVLFFFAILFLVFFLKINYGVSLTFSFPPLALFVLGLSFLMTFLFSYAFGMLSFWVIETRGLKNFKEVIFYLFSGQALPLAFLPIWLVKINDFLPFKYIIAMPIAVLQGKMTEAGLVEVLAVQIFWCLVLFLLLMFLWKRGITRYCAVGG